MVVNKFPTQNTIIAILCSFLLLAILVLDITKACETFGNREYDDIATHKKLPRTSCLELLVQKGWIDPNDKDEGSRKTIASDMQIARVPQSQYSTVVYPHIEACVFPERVLDIYTNTKGENIINANTCSLKGRTMDGDIVFYGLEKINGSSEIHPKGCMLDLSKVAGKADMTKFLDDVYKIKNHPYDQERIDYINMLEGKHNLLNS